MNIKKLGFAAGLCALPPIVGFLAGVLSIQSPKLFGWLMGMALVTGFACMARCTTRAGCGLRAFEVEQVNVAAGAFLALSFIFSLWTGIAWAAGYGLLRAGVVVVGSTTGLAILMVTFVREVINGRVRLARSQTGAMPGTQKPT